MPKCQKPKKNRSTVGHEMRAGVRLHPLKATVCIKANSTRKARKRFFGGIKRCRCIATHYEKEPANFAGFHWLAAMTTDPI